MLLISHLYSCSQALVIPVEYGVDSSNSSFTFLEHNCPLLLLKRILYLNFANVSMYRSEFNVSFFDEIKNLMMRHERNYRGTSMENVLITSEMAFSSYSFVGKNTSIRMVTV